MVNCFLGQVPGTVHYREQGLLQFSTSYDELNYVECFFGVRRRVLSAFEHKGKCRIVPTAVIIRLIEPEAVLQIRVRSLLERRLAPVVSFSSTQECINPGEHIKKGNADLGFARNDCTG